MKDRKLLKGDGRGRQDGNIIIEMACVLPILLLVVGGIIDFGLAYWKKHVLTNATREGARVAAFTRDDGGADRTVAQVRQVVQDYLDNFNVMDDKGTPITLVRDTNFVYSAAGTNPTQLTVTLQNIPTRLFVLPAVAGLKGTLNLGARTIMNAEWTTAPTDY